MTHCATKLAFGRVGFNFSAIWLRLGPAWFHIEDRCEAVLADQALASADSGTYLPDHIIDVAERKSSQFSIRSLSLCRRLREKRR